jgi:hypothetical protein
MKKEEAKEFLNDWFRISIRNGENRVSKLEESIATGRLGAAWEKDCRDEVEHLKKLIANMNHSWKIFEEM